MNAITREEHKVTGQATCPKCGKLVQTNQEGKLWDHFSPNNGPWCQASWTLPETWKVQAAASILGKLGGKSTSPAKQAASRANGRKGGRPAKSTATPN